MAGCCRADGWNRQARIAWPRRELAVDIEASDELGTYVLYSANGASDFVCFEPVSHPVGAFNLPGGPHHYGLKTLRDGESLRAWSRYGPSQLQAMRA